MARIRTRDDGLGEFLDGDILRVKMHSMDQAPTNIDAVLRRELFDERMQDAHMRRPGFRYSPARAEARQAIEDAYRSYQQDTQMAWRSPEARLAEAKRTAEEWGSMNGKSDPSDPEYRSWRRKQSARRFVERDPHDDDHEVCPYCGGTGWRVYEEPDKDDDEATPIVRRETQTQQRLDQLRRDHAERMTREYALQDAELSRAWRKG